MRSSIGRQRRSSPFDLDEVERTERRPRPVTIVADQTEDGQTGGIADDGFAVDDARMHRQCRDRLDGKGKAVAEVFTLPTDQSHLFAVAPGNDPKAVVLDLVNPVGREGSIRAGDTVVALGYPPGVWRAVDRRSFSPGPARI